MRKVRLAIQLTTTLGLVAVAVFLVWGRDLAQILDGSVHKLTYQFCLLVVAGGAVSWLYRELSRLRESTERDRQQFRELHSDLVAAYNAYKRTKRLLRAKAWRTGGGRGEKQISLLRVQAYGSLVEDLNDIQLEFESMVRRVNGRKDLFRPVDGLYGADQPGGLAKDIETIEKYLNKVVQEYESALRAFRDDPEYIPLSDMQAVSEFIASGDGSSDRRDAAASSFRRAIDHLATVAMEKY